MPKYTVSFTNIYVVEADSETEALDKAEQHVRHIDGECFVEQTHVN
jgi:uncharacterized membrane-anchored protein YitT (DUF2179 family)